MLIKFIILYIRTLLRYLKFVVYKPSLYVKKMSATKCVLRNERPERPGEFTFTWSVENFSYFTNEGDDWLNSPDFLVKFLGENRLWLTLYPRGDGAPGFVSCYLCGQDEATFMFTLAIRTSNGQFKESGVNVFNVSVFNGYLKFVSFQELEGSAGYLDNDTLTVRCRIWKTGEGITASIKREAHSRIKVSTLDYPWILNDISNLFENEFNKSVEITEFFTDDTKINLQLFKKGSLGEGSLQFGIEMTKPKKKYFWIAVVHLMDADGRVAHSARGEKKFNSSNETLLWDFPLISIDEIYTDKKLYLPNNQLTLRCELSFSADNEVETSVLRKTNEREIESTSMNPLSELQGVWIKNMQQCYKERKFSDFIIRTPAQKFFVHRFILSAHSEVFDEMLKRGMKESETGIIDIEDLDDETVSKMLAYVYTSTFDVTDCPAAQNLYFAADKYGIADLKEQCSSYLMSCLDASNVCDILELADRHGDEDLTSYARNFFQAHAKEIMASDSWKKLKENNSPLALEIMEWFN